MIKYFVKCCKCGHLPLNYNGYYAVNKSCKRCLTGIYKEFISERFDKYDSKNFFKEKR